MRPDGPPGNSGSEQEAGLSALRNDSFVPGTVHHPIDQAVLNRFWRGKEVVTVGVLSNFFERLTGVLGHQAVDIEIQAKEILFLKETLNGLMADHTGQPLDKIAEDTDRDYFLSPAEAVQYGLIDRVVDSSGGEGIVTEG